MLCAEAREAAQKLLNHYVKVSCSQISRVIFFFFIYLLILVMYIIFIAQQVSSTLAISIGLLFIQFHSHLRINAAVQDVLYSRW